MHLWWLTKSLCWKKTHQVCLHSKRRTACVLLQWGGKILPEVHGGGDHKTRTLPPGQITGQSCGSVPQDRPHAQRSSVLWGARGLEKAAAWEDERRATEPSSQVTRRTGKAFNKTRRLVVHRNKESLWSTTDTASLGGSWESRNSPVRVSTFLHVIGAASKVLMLLPARCSPPRHALLSSTNLQRRWAASFDWHITELRRLNQSACRWATQRPWTCYAKC